MALTEAEQKRAYTTLIALSDSVKSLQMSVSVDELDDLRSIAECINRLEETLRPNNYPYSHKLRVNFKPKQKNLSWFDTILLGLAEGFEQEAREKAEKKRRRKERMNKFLRRK
ncbi:hypothetical protein Grass_236 [Bacillus phage Grass]|uniref:Uncharacterized protein n=1 Tax=Bacillus phage Grass TaxID=1406785 RepID=U5PUT5_BPGRA|nr:hypothetical protein Grass_236 [Bacillus phage Grass]AGY47501.1 hypothetical protein Grass_236 [Bacillus phage Grass]